MNAVSIVFVLDFRRRGEVLAPQAALLVVEQVAVVNDALLRKLVEQVDVVLRVLRLLGLQLPACVEQIEAHEHAAA